MPHNNLYVKRDLSFESRSRVIDHFRKQGIECHPDLHVTICFSRTPVDWSKAKPITTIEYVGDNNSREMKLFGQDGNILVMVFECANLSARHDYFVEKLGASFDFAEYQPHLTISYSVDPALDISSIKPYTGYMVFEAEEFEPIVAEYVKRFQ